MTRAPILVPNDVRGARKEPAALIVTDSVVTKYLSPYCPTQVVAERTVCSAGWAICLPNRVEVESAIPWNQSPAEGDQGWIGRSETSTAEIEN
jgi:hypothetical protein